MKKILIVSLWSIPVMILAASLEVGPYTVTVNNTDVPRVKAYLNSLPDRRVLVTETNVVAVEPPVAEAEWDIELDPNVAIENGFVVAYTNFSSRWIDDPLMAVDGTETAPQLNAKLKVKLEWLVGQYVENSMNKAEKRWASERAAKAIESAWASSNTVFEIEVTP